VISDPQRPARTSWKSSTASSALPAMKEQLPAAMPSTRATIAPRPSCESVRDVKMTLLATIGCRARYFPILRNVSATVIPSLALPASLVARSR
jgi:HAE1 family hydrophobic/amphiphilic exporter-1